MYCHAIRVKQEWNKPSYFSFTKYKSGRTDKDDQHILACTLMDKLTVKPISQNTWYVPSRVEEVEMGKWFSLKQFSLRQSET